MTPPTPLPSPDNRQHTNVPRPPRLPRYLVHMLGEEDPEWYDEEDVKDATEPDELSRLIKGLES